MLFVTAGDIIMLLFVELRSRSSGAAVKRMNLEEFLKQFAKDEENKKVAIDFYPFSSNIIMFQQFEIPAEGQ